MTNTTNQPSSVWRNVSFLLMWSSVAASGFGDRLIQLAAEPMLGVDEPNASAAKITAAISFFFFVPYMLLTIVGGFLADRLPRKWIMLACDQGRAIVLFIAFLFASQIGAVRAIDPSHHWKIYTIIALTGAFAAIFNPARQATVPQIVPPKHLQQANAVIAGIALIASLIGFQIGGPIIEKYSVGLGIIIGAIAYFVSGWFFAFLKISPRSSSITTAKSSIFSQMSKAVGYIHCHASVRNLIILNITFWAAAWVVNAAISALNNSHYTLPDNVQYLSAKATMMACLGLGTLAGSFFVMWLKTRRESGIVAMASLLIAGIAIFLLAAIKIYYVGLLLAFTIGLTGGIFLICVDTLTQSITPNYLRGRVFGLRSMLNTLFGVLINLAIWLLPQSRADNIMIPLLYTTASILSIAAALSLFRQLTTGPTQTKSGNAVWRINRLFTLVWHRLTWINRHNIPTAGSVIITANHTAGLDPFLIQAASLRMIRWVMIGKYKFKCLDFLWNVNNPIIVNQDGTDLTQLREMLRELKTDSLVGIFPEGGLQREHRQLQPFEPGIGLLAKRSKALIVPIWIHGTPQTNSIIWHFLKPSKSIIIFGKPYRPDPDLDPQQITEDLRKRMLKLAEQIDPMVAGAEQSAAPEPTPPSDPHKLT